MGVTASGVNYRTATLQPMRRRQIPCQKLHESRTRNTRICIGKSAKKWHQNPAIRASNPSPKILPEPTQITPKSTSKPGVTNLDSRP
jgi:hypothetical protein